MSKYFKFIEYKKENNIAIVSLNRPAELNALSASLYEELYTVFDQIDSDKQVKVLILTGKGDKAFAAGADIENLKHLSPWEARNFALLAYKAQNRLVSLSQITIAALNGYALGGGCELAMCCDLRFASEKAKIGLPEINLGIIPGGGGTQRLTRLIGITKAKELIFTGKILSANEALDLCLINKIVPHNDLMKEVKETASELKDKSFPALVLAKTAIDNGSDVSLERGLNYEIECFAECFASGDHVEGINAFIEKRSPIFKDKSIE